MLRAELDDARERLRVAQVKTTRHECMVQALVLERASLVETTAEVTVESHLTVETKEVSEGVYSFFLLHIHLSPSRSLPLLLSLSHAHTPLFPFAGHAWLS